ncbi:MAG: hypothetical protein L0099_12465, partial [Acidobacteria bacterium]|nr:hypothetical protein [Acidobacteriota bacterium]
RLLGGAPVIESSGRLHPVEIRYRPAKAGEEMDAALARSVLAALPATWSKLDYVAGLRRNDGGYSHWGLERTHGPEAMRGALSAAHRELFLGVLRTPLAQLLDDARRAAAHQDLDTVAYLAALTARSAALLPEDQGGGSGEHLSLVLDALASLVRGRPPANPPGA